jgi:hypothetical protein
MPSRVRWFVILSLLTVSLGTVWIAVFRAEFEALATARMAPETASAVILFAYGSQIALYAIQVLFVWLIAFRRKNWARWVLLVMTIVNDLPLVGPMLTQRHGIPFQTEVLVVSILMDAIALYLVFTGNARPWFRKAAA